MENINQVMKQLLATGEKPKDIADILGVTVAMISTWKNKENDFVPRLPVAAKIYKQYKYTVYPYAQEALENYDT